MSVEVKCDDCNHTVRSHETHYCICDDCWEKRDEKHEAEINTLSSEIEILIGDLNNKDDKIKELEMEIERLNS